jgi:hypothetical protein
LFALFCLTDFVKHHFVGSQISGIELIGYVCVEMGDDADAGCAHRLLSVAEHFVKSGFHAELVTVCAAPSRKLDDVVVLGRVLTPPPPEFWDVYADACNQTIVIDEEIPTEWTGPSVLYEDGSRHSAQRVKHSPFSTDCKQDGSQYNSYQEQGSPNGSLLPKILFAENDTAQQQRVPAEMHPPSVSAQQRASEETSQSSTTVETISTSLTQLVDSMRNNITVVNGSCERLCDLTASDITTEVIIYWVTRTHRVVENSALLLAVRLSRELRVPLIAVVSLVPYLQCTGTSPLRITVLWVNFCRQ